MVKIVASRIQSAQWTGGRDTPAAETRVVALDPAVHQFVTSLHCAQRQPRSARVAATTSLDRSSRQVDRSKPG